MCCTEIPLTPHPPGRHMLFFFICFNVETGATEPPVWSFSCNLMLIQKLYNMNDITIKVLLTLLNVCSDHSLPHAVVVF